MKTNFQLFDFNYQFDDVTFKKKLEDSVIEYYYDYEIGQATPDMFKRKFKARWLRMIDHYNQLYNTTLLDYNPLVNYSISEALEQLNTSTNKQDTTTDGTQNSITDNTTTATSDSQTTSNDTTKHSDYPQQPIAGGNFLSGESNSTTNTSNEDTSKTTNESNTNLTSENTSSVTGSGSNNTTYSKTIEGITGTTYQDLIIKHRETLLRITEMVIQELKPCFILVH